MPSTKKKVAAKASLTDELEPALDEVMGEDEDIDPNALVEDGEEKDGPAGEALPSVEEEEGEDPLVLAKKDDDDEDDAKPVVEEVSDGLEDEDGIKALNRAEKELHEMEFGSGGDAEEPEEEMM